jgi:hypothetical protein
VTIPNGDTHYEVFFSADRLSDYHTIDAGINVTVKRDHVATVKCRTNTLEQQLEGIDLAQDQ